MRPLDAGEIDYMQQFKQGEIRLERGEILFDEGETSRRLYTVLDGIAIRYRSLEDGRRQIVNFMFPGDLVGLQGAFDEPASHAVEALVTSRLCVFDRRRFHDLIADRPELGFDVIWLAAQEENALEGHILSLGRRSASERVTYLAVWLLDRALESCLFGDENRLEVSITQTQVADMLGLSLVHTNRTIKALERTGLVHWTQRAIVVPDMDKACEFAQFERSSRRRRPFI